MKVYVVHNYLNNNHSSCLVYSTLEEARIQAHRLIEPFKHIMTDDNLIWRNGFHVFVFIECKNLGFGY